MLQGDIEAAVTVDLRVVLPPTWRVPDPPTSPSVPPTTSSDTAMIARIASISRGSGVKRQRSGAIGGLEGLPSLHKPFTRHEALREIRGVLIAS